MRNSILTREELIELFDFDNIDKRIGINAEYLLRAISDYPVGVNEPIEYLNVLKNKIQNPLIFDHINDFISKLDVKNDAWIMESLSEARMMFDRNKKTTTLDDLIIELSIYRKGLKNNNKK